MHHVAKGLEPLSFNVSFSSEYSGLISFRIDWFDLLAVQRTLKSLLQNHNLKALILWRSAFPVVQLSWPSMIPGKTIVLSIWTFVSKAMSLIFNLPSVFVMAFFPRSKCLLISWLQSPSAVILEPQKIKSDTVSTVSPSICREMMGPYLHSEDITSLTFTVDKAYTFNRSLRILLI